MSLLSPPFYAVASLANFHCNLDGETEVYAQPPKQLLEIDIELQIDQ
ncbi:predicted protein [Sclerotinia sclerotiorum 1980 UF-70]|uniref:Uncharacterized protein n=1 Tax=Sclerotinia sclerotiorum (strain ATCC 18683 / 1980 / Ss-1) TaxID=665079 RepID=A7EJN7_SCLS1|nr:predicted protein [Sclerotinia sclerotiorum 1980 UF-70]EDO03053.1 predicted protein [Sclerotinia sclerotiorum 1980 UF-70]